MYMGLSHRLTRPGGDLPPALVLNLLQGTLDPRLTFARGSTATDIVNGVLTTYGVDVPRLTSAKGLLVEGARTNMLGNGGSWFVSNGVYTLGQSDPAGGSAARLISVNAGTFAAFSYLEGDTTTAGAVYTASQFVKPGNVVNRVQLFVHLNGSTGYANFYLSGAGSVSAFSGVSNPQIQALANGWYRVSCSYTSSVACASRSGLVALQTGSEARLPTLTWVGTETFSVCFAQHEQGGGATSYIPTTTVSATRAADICTGSIGPWLNAAEGTVVVEACPADSDPAAATSPRFLTFSGSTSLHEIRRNAADTLAQAGTTTNGVVQSSLAGSAWTSGTTARAAYAWKNNDMAFCFAGGTVATDATSPDGMPLGLTSLRIGASSAISGFLFGWVRSVKVWGQRLPDNQLKGLSA